MKNNKLKVMQVCGGVGPGGAESFYLRLVRALNEHSEVEVLPVVRVGSWLAERLDELEIPYKATRFGGMFDFSTKGVLQRLVASYKPDLVQTWMNRASRFMPRTGVPTVGRLGGYYNLKYYRKADYLIGNTEDICRYIRKQGWPADKVGYVPNFVDLPPENFRQFRLDVREEYRIPHDARLVLLAGRLHENKAFDIALVALNMLPENVYAIMAGKGPEEQALKAAVEADGLTSRVRFAGWVNNLTPLFAAADVFVVPSRHEPLGNVVLEGWAHQIPVIAADASGPASLIQQGESGVLVPVDDEKALARGIQDVLDNPELAQKMVQTGLRQLQLNYTQGVVVEQYLKLFRELTGRES